MSFTLRSSKHHDMIKRFPPGTKINLQLNLNSVANILDTVYGQKQPIESRGNFWAAIQSMQQQFFGCVETMNSEQSKGEMNHATTSDVRPAARHAEEH